MRLRMRMLLVLVLVLSLDQTESKDREKRRGTRRRDGEDKPTERLKPLKLKLVPPTSALIGPEPSPSDPRDPIGSQSQGRAAIGPEESLQELLKTEADPQYHTEPALDVVEKWQQQQKKKDEARRRKKRKRDKKKRRDEQVLRMQVKQEQNQWKQMEAELRKQEEAELRKQEEAELRKQEEAELRKQEEAELRKQMEAELRKQMEAEFRQSEEEVQVWLLGDVFEINREEERTPPTAKDYELTRVHEEELEEEELEEELELEEEELEEVEPSVDRGGLPQGCDISDVTVSCENAGLQHFPPLSIPELKSLSLEANNISSIPAEAFNGIPNLEWINLKKNRLTSAQIHPLAFRTLKFLTRLYLDENLLESVPPGLPPTLQELKVNENRLQGIHETSLKGLSVLVTLELEGNRISEGVVAHGAFKDLSELSYLRLGRNDFRAVPQGLPHSLQELHLEHNQIEEISDTVFNRTQSLTLISLRNNRLEESRIAPHAWIHHRALESLDLSNNQLHLVPSFLPQPLVHLVLVGNHIERIPGYVFAHMSPGLEYLYLSYNKLDGDGFEPESFFGTHESMVELCLDHNQLLTVPSGIAEMTSLHFLRLDHNKIRTVPEESLCDSALDAQGTLVALRLDNNFIDPETVSPSAFSCVRASSSIVLKPQHSTKERPPEHH